MNTPAKIRKKIVVLGTKSRGGIRTVIENYESDGIYLDHDYVLINTHGEYGALRNILYFILSLVKLAATLSTSRPVIVHAHASMGGSFYRKSICLWITKLFRKKFIYHLHGSEFKLFFDDLGFIGRKYLISTFNVVDLFITLSESWKDYIESRCQAKVAVIYNYVRNYDFNGSSGETDKLDGSESVSPKIIQLLFLGVIGPRKGVFDLIEALSLLKVNNPNLRFALKIGGNGDVNQLRNKITERNLDEEVHFLGWVGHENKLNLIREADVVILPSYNEGLPMVILEALALRTAVIATPVGGIPEVIVDRWSGLLVTPGDIESLAKAIFDLASDKTLLENISDGGHDVYLEKFSAETMLPKIRNIYSSL